MKTILTIPGELADLNSYIKSLNASRWGGNRIKRDETERVAWQAKNAKIAPITAYPVRLMFRWYSKDARKDLDNCSFSKKYVLDGLVEAGVLVNDSRKYVSGFSDEFYIDRKNPRVEVEILHDSPHDAIMSS